MTTRRRKLAALLFAPPAVLAAAATWWAMPGSDVPTPGPDAAPAEVVQAYVAALDARDFDTANAIDQTRSDYGRFDRVAHFEDLEIISVRAEPHGRVDVLFRADIRGLSGMSDGRQDWGYVLERGDDRAWHIVDAGVA